MKIPLLDLDAQLNTIRDEMHQAVTDVLDSTRYIMGPKVTELEEAVAKYSGVRYGIGVSSGTDALLIALMALDIQPGDLVITTTYSFFATSGVIARLNAIPVFIDCQQDSYNLDPGLLQNWFDENPNKVDKVKCIIPVHLYGQCADMNSILTIADKYDIPVIEDGAQAIGSTYPSKDGVKKAGSMGNMGCFSFFPSKNLGGIGDGGMVVTDNQKLAEKLVKLRNHGSSPKYYHALIGGNFRLDAIQAAALSVKLRYLEKWHEARRKNAAYYDENLSDAIHKPMMIYGREHHIYNQYIISVPEKRDEFRKYLSDNQIGNEVYYPVPFHLQECFQYLGYKNGDFPNAEYASAHTVAIPIYPELTHEMQNYVIEKINAFWK